MKTLFYLFAVFLAIGCQTEEQEPDAEQELENSSPEVIIAGDMGVTLFGNMALHVQQTEDYSILEGDILIPEDQNTKIHAFGEPVKSAAVVRGFWENNTVYYSVDPLLPDKQRVVDAIKHWELNTNIDFKERSGEQDYVYFTAGAGCASYLGKIGGKQVIFLHSSCSTGNTIHEIGHAIGLWHEHSRSDRDQFVKIHWDNIRSGMEFNFENFSESFSTPSGQNLTATLDFNSVMMYYPYAFSANGLPTITKVDGSTYRTQRTGLSSEDIKGINKIYPASGEPEYEHGKYYTINNLTVLRYNEKWLYRSYWGWKEVELRDGRWHYVNYWGK